MEHSPSSKAHLIPAYSTGTQMTKPTIKDKGE